MSSSAVRQAPPVGVVCRGRGWRFVQVLLAASAAASITAWALQRAGVFHAGLLAMAAAVAAAATALLAWRLLRREPATLCWDGQQWTLDAEPITPAVMMDVAGVLLLRARAPQRRTRWLAASRSDAGPAWHALRVAAYARPRSAMNDARARAVA